jgi:ankyrin repeat protein
MKKHTHLLHTQLIQAIENGDLDEVKHLISEGVKVNYANDTYSRTAIEKASEIGKLEIVRFLIESRANVNNYYERHPLVVATSKNFVDISNLLIEAGADVNTNPNEDLTPLSNAVSSNSIGLVRKLVEAGADVNAWGDESNPALSLAGCDGYREIYEYLFPLVDPELREEFILEGFCMAGTSFAGGTSSSLNGIEFLVEMGGNINGKDSQGITPLMFLTKNNHIEPIKKMIELGADPHIAGKDGKTPFSIAIEEGWTEIINLFKGL